jgi:hypothetical protein
MLGGLLSRMVQGIEWCQLDASPAAAILTRLTLLHLRENSLNNLADTLPADGVRNLKVLDISGNCFGQKPDTMGPWTAENIAAFSSGNWANLQVLGIRPSSRYGKRDSFEATADALGAVLQQQAAAAQPPRPAPIVVYSELHEELLSPAQNLAWVK